MKTLEITFISLRAEILQCHYVIKAHHAILLTLVYVPSFKTRATIYKKYNRSYVLHSRRKYRVEIPIEFNKNFTAADQYSCLLQRAFLYNLTKRLNKLSYNMLNYMLIELLHCQETKT